MQDASYKNNNSKIQTQLSANRINTSFSLDHQRKNKQNSAWISPYTKLTEATGSILGGLKPKGRNNSTFFKESIQLFLKPYKRDLKHNNLKKIMKKKINTAQMKEQTRNTEVQINEEEIGKLPEKKDSE